MAQTGTQTHFFVSSLFTGYVVSDQGAIGMLGGGGRGRGRGVCQPTKNLIEVHLTYFPPPLHYFPPPSPPPSPNFLLPLLLPLLTSFPLS